MRPNNRPNSVVRRSITIPVAKTAEPIEMLFGLWTAVDQESMR